MAIACFPFIRFAVRTGELTPVALFPTPDLSNQVAILLPELNVNVLLS